eukprot:COSAG02_NODE_38603_length_427_cov_0.820122_1_plen_34_part_01
MPSVNFPKCIRSIRRRLHFVATLATTTAAAAATT